MSFDVLCYFSCFCIWFFSSFIVINNSFSFSFICVQLLSSFIIIDALLFFLSFAFNFVQTSMSSPPCIFYSLQFSSFEFCRHCHLASGYLGLVLRARSLWIAFFKFLTFGFALILHDILFSCFTFCILVSIVNFLICFCLVSLHFTMSNLLFTFICVLLHLQEQRSVNLQTKK